MPKKKAPKNVTAIHARRVTSDKRMGNLGICPAFIRTKPNS